MEFKEREKYKHLTGIYMIQNLKNGFVYIGQTANPFHARFASHRNHLGTNKHPNMKLQNDYNIYGGDCFRFEVVAIEENRENLNKLERDYIQYYRKLGICYNKKSGGEFVPTISSEGRESISNYMKNRDISDDTKQRIREANIGSKSPVTSLDESKVAKIKERLVDGEIQRIIAANYNVSMGTISAIANGRTWTHVTVSGWDDYMKTHCKKTFLTKEEVLEIKKLLSEDGCNQSEIARRYGCYSSTISNIALGKTFKNL